MFDRILKQRNSNNPLPVCLCSKSVLFQNQSIDDNLWDLPISSSISLGLSITFNSFEFISPLLFEQPYTNISCKKKLLQQEKIEQLKSAFTKVTAEVAKQFSQSLTRRDIEEQVLNVPHICEAVQNLLGWLQDIDVLEIGFGLGNFYKSQGAYVQAINIWEHCSSIIEGRTDNEHPYVAVCLCNLGLLDQAQGKYSAAESKLQRVLQLYKKLIGEQHPDLATHLNNLGLLYQAQGRYKDAEPLLIQALEFRKILRNDKHPDLAVHLNNLAMLYQEQELYDDAEKLLLQALNLVQNLPERQHPDLVTSLDNLGLVYQSKKRFSEAEPLLIRALEIRKRLLHKDHPDIANSLSNIGSFYYAQQRYLEAESVRFQKRF